MVSCRNVVTPLRSPRLDGFDWVAHGFGTRDDGAWTPFEQTARLRQVHAAGVVAVTAPGEQGDGDASITAVPGVWLEIRTADCVPLLLADPVRRIVAAVHAGWRGTAAAISRTTVETLQYEWGSNPIDIHVAIGPCIAACCFEVGEDVAAHFPGHVDKSTTRPHVDLVSANRQQLVAAGIPAANIEDLNLCTVCDPARFHSFRRDRGTGRMIAAIQIRNGATA
jgi:polyphenol oxidase